MIFFVVNRADAYEVVAEIHTRQPLTLGGHGYVCASAVVSSGPTISVSPAPSPKGGESKEQPTGLIPEEDFRSVIWLAAASY